MGDQRHVLDVGKKAKLQQAILALIPTDTALAGTDSTVPGVQRNTGPCGVHGREVGVYQPSSQARRASGIQPTDARATSGLSWILVRGHRIC
ncbi:hypothetical protein GIB67_008195, partial [Kingdonia uniflora]